MDRKKEIREMANTTASHITSDKDMQVDFADMLRMGAEWADQHPHWISVEEIQPKEDEWFLGYSPLKSPLSSMKIDVYNFNSNGLIEAHGITHWMPLPLPPKEGGNQ